MAKSEDRCLRQIAQAVAEVDHAIGHRVPQERLDGFWATFLDAAQAVGLDANRLLYSLRNSDVRSPEWQALIARLAVGETYFFREDAAIAALRSTILPSLFEVRKQGRVFKAWCAGCSTGEEAYTLSILVREVLPKREDWSVSIVGSDVNASAIESARTAAYREWSLRTCGVLARERYFVETDDGYVLRQPFRKAVSFAFHNLVDLQGGAPQGAPFDLVLCRNVAIYLDAKALRRTFTMLCSALAPDGFLVIGASDPPPPPELGLRFCNIRGVVAFRCQGKSGSRTESSSGSGPIDFDSDPAAKRVDRASGSER